MYSYTEKALSKAEISVISDKTQMNQTDSLHFQTCLKFKAYNKFSIHCSFQVNSESILVLIGWQGQVFKLVLIFQTI